MEECSFAPDTLPSQRIYYPSSSPQRDLYGFLGDQQLFLERKAYNNMQRQQNKYATEMVEVKRTPQLDLISDEIVKGMDDRKVQPTYMRLYN